MSDDLTAQLSSLSDEDLLLAEWEARWKHIARPKQLAPPGDWDFTLVLAGRGFGKTLAGGNWIGLEAARDPGSYSHVIAPTLNDVRFTCFEGVSGLLNTIPAKLIDDYNKSYSIIRLINGSIIRGFSSEEPERLRGPQCARMWCDEFAAWTNIEETWDMAMFGLRLGSHPRAYVTTTPKPRDKIRELIKNPKCVIVNGSTYENKDNLPGTFFKQVSQYEGTRLGRQELYGEMIDPEETGIVRRSQIKLWKAERRLPNFHYIVVSLDTAFSERTTDKKTHDPDPTACTIWGLFKMDDMPRPGIMLLDAWEDMLGFPQLIEKARRMLQSRFGGSDTPLIKPMYGSPRITTDGRTPDLLIIEDKGSGISLRQVLEREGVPAYKYNPGKADKLQRLHMVSHLFEQGYIWMVESDKRPGQIRTWAEPVLSQLCSFTGEGSIRHDDFVDSTTQALRVIMDKMIGAASNPRPLSSGRPSNVYNFPRVNPYAA